MLLYIYECKNSSIFKVSKPLKLCHRQILLILCNLNLLNFLLAVKTKMIR